MTTIPRDWQELLNALRSEGVKFLLIGGHALAFHVEARLTEGLDISVEASPENAARLAKALERFGFGGLVDEATLALPDKVFMLGVKPWRIDVLTGIDGVTFEEAWESRLATTFHGVPLDVIGRKALLKNKRAAGRKKDRMDVLLLEEEPHLEDD